MRASRDGDYGAWIRDHDALGADDRPALEAAVQALVDKPLITVALLADGEAEMATARRMLEEQHYPAWELVATTGIGADGAGIAGAFVAILACGDELAPDALLELVALLASEPDADIIYTDDDLLAGPPGAPDRRQAPRFKTGWDPDLLLAGDVFDGLTLYRRDLLARTAAWATMRDRYALALLATHATTPDRIRHVPRVLCHVRQRAPRDDRTVATVQAHLDRIAPGASVERTPAGPHRVRWPLPDPPPLVSIIVPSRDRPDLLARCAAGVLDRTSYAPIELLVVDNDSREDEALALLDRLARDVRVRVLRHPGPFNHSAMNNQAAREAHGEVLVLLNNDVEILEGGWLRELVGHALRPDVGGVGAKLLFPDGTLQHGGVTLAAGPIVRHVLHGAAGEATGWNEQLAVAREFSAVTAACLAMRRSTLEDVGGFDEDAFPTSYNDVDLCLRIADLGYRLVWTPFAVLTHHESASRPRLVTEPALLADRLDLDRLFQRWRDEIEADPFSPPCLQLHDTTEVMLTAPRRAPPWRSDRREPTSPVRPPRDHRSGEARTGDGPHRDGWADRARARAARRAGVARRHAAEARAEAASLRTMLRREAERTADAEARAGGGEQAVALARQDGERLAAALRELSDAHAELLGSTTWRVALLVRQGFDLVPAGLRRAWRRLRSPRSERRRPRPE